MVACELKKGDSTPTVLALVKKNSRGLRRGYVLNYEEALESIRSAISDAERIIKQKIRHLSLSIGGTTLESKILEGGVVVSRPDAEINQSDILRAIDQAEASLPDSANRQVLHRIPISFKLDGKKVPGRPEGLKGSKLEVRALFISYSSLHLKDVVRMLDELGIVVDDIVASPLSASTALLSRVQKMAGCVLVNIGSQTTSIAVYEDGLPISVQVFPLGSTDITNDIALGFRIPLEDAERIKKGDIDSSTPKKKLDEIISARLADIFQYIEMHLKKLGRNGLLPAGIIITGGGSGISNIEDLAKNYFKLPAKIAHPDIAQISKNQIKDSSWAVAYGLCLFIFLDNPEDSFLPRRHGAKSPTIWSTIGDWFKELLP